MVKQTLATSRLQRLGLPPFSPHLRAKNAPFLGNFPADWLIRRNCFCSLLFFARPSIALATAMWSTHHRTPRRHVPPRPRNTSCTFLCVFMQWFVGTNAHCDIPVKAQTATMAMAVIDSLDTVQLKRNAKERFFGDKFRNQPVSGKETPFFQTTARSHNVKHTRNNVFVFGMEMDAVSLHHI